MAAFDRLRYAPAMRRHPAVTDRPSSALRAPSRRRAWAWAALGAALAACGGGGGAGAPAVPAPSTDASLGSLIVSAGALAPAFSPEVLTYAVHAGTGVTDTTVTPSLGHAFAHAAVNGQPVSSGVSSSPVALVVGTTSILVDVTAEDGTTHRIYTIAVQRDPDPPADPWPHRLFSPFVDAGLWPTLGAVSDAVLDAQGIEHVHLGFVVEDAFTAREPAWAGVYRVGSTDAVTGDAGITAGIDRVRAHGGDVVASFGGAAGLELAAAFQRAGKSASELQQVYQRVIDRYALTYVDFDVEGFLVADTPSIALRSQAMRGLQDAATAAGRTLRISLTLPVMPTGLDTNGRAVMASAWSAGVVLDCVNVMCMDYGAATADMGGAAVSAGEALVAQIRTLDPSKTRAQACRLVGLTPMIGVNDTSPETFTAQDAGEVVAWAQANDIRMLSMWSLNRDHAGSGLATTHSGLAQSDFDFTHAFQAFGR